MTLLLHHLWDGHVKRAPELFLADHCAETQGRQPPPSGLGGKQNKFEFFCKEISLNFFSLRRGFADIAINGTMSN